MSQPDESPEVMVCKAFSTPDEGDADGAVELVWRTAAGVLLRRLADRAVARSGSASLSDVLVRFAARGSFEDLWHVNIGRLRKGLRASQSPLTLAVHAALQAHACGLEGRWSARLPEPTIAWIGPYLLPPSLEFHVDADGRTIDVTLDGPIDRVTLTRASGWRDVLGTARRVGTSLEVDRGREIVIVDEVNAPIVGSVVAPPDVRANRAVAVSAYRAGFELLAEVAPRWRGWISRLIRVLIPSECGPDMLVSGSSPGECGLAFTSVPDDPIGIAEMLVHEASHQYFHLAGCVGQLDDGSDRQLYYSPFKRKDRPIDRLLLAHHAFANVVLFHHELESVVGPSDAARCLASRARVDKQLLVIEPPLSAARSLTPIGRALLDGLLERLRRIRSSSLQESLG